MTSHTILRFIADKLRDPSTWVVALVVGAIINLYGQFLLPWFRGSFDPPVDFLIEFEIRPEITVFSVFLGFAFPFCVGLYSAVTARWKNRHMEVLSSLPDACPDPMFRVASDGALVQAGATTQAFMQAHGIDHAAKLLGAELWARIASGDGIGDRSTVRFAAEGASFLVTHSPAGNGDINLYLCRLPPDLETAPPVAGEEN